MALYLCFELLLCTNEISWNVSLYSEFATSIELCARNHYKFPIVLLLGSLELLMCPGISFDFSPHSEGDRRLFVSCRCEFAPASSQVSLLDNPCCRTLHCGEPNADHILYLESSGVS